ncbi:hypothetical protein [Curtobacterium sp. NPDC089185]|uniref:hypothetical protein n=1 Tax=Curtobacterium sp. NPDC089185 TaxID=3154968 RepID=UPI00343010AA
MGFRVVGVVAGLLALGIGVGLSACTSSSSADAGRDWCVPLLTVAPVTVQPGDTVTLRSEDRCDAPVPDGGWHVVATVPQADGPEVAFRSADSFDGSWSASVTLPRDFPVGDAVFGIADWDDAPCSDTSGSCAAASGSFTVRAAD